jgi:hypothetical protein
MNSLVKFAVIAGFAALAGCGGKGDDSLGDNVAQAYDNQADQLDAMAENATTEGTEEALQNQADALREEGERKEEAIDEADVNAAAVNSAAVNAM